MFKLYFLIPFLIPLALARWDFCRLVFQPVERWVEWVAEDARRALWVVGVMSLIVSAGLSMGIGIPAPQTHDEFGYLLLGDTFAHGRVTNPTPPLWEHFETIHEIMTPTYTAKYPPGQGVALALGELMGRPIIGVWISTALACMAMCWMLQAWMPGRWALVGGVLTAFHPQVVVWSQNYWGGAVAMGAGALVVGGLRRLMSDEPRARDAAVMGVGIAVLGNSRPFEGLVFSLLMGVCLFTWLVRERRVPVGKVFKRMVAPLALVMALMACEVGYYNWRVTGHPMKMPYMVHIETYGIDPVFVFSKPRAEPVFRHWDIQNLQETYLRYYLDQRKSWGSLGKATVEKIGDLVQSYFVSFILLVPLVGLPWALRRDGKLRMMLWSGAIFMGALMLETWMHAHYAAPGAGVFFLLEIEGMRVLNGMASDGRRWGRNVVRGLVVLLAIAFGNTVVKLATAPRDTWYARREALIERLRREPERSLVIVKYGPEHNPHREWVYNEADLPNAKVILAQDMGAAKNKELTDYFKDRKVWVLDADAEMPVVAPMY